MTLYHVFQIHNAVYARRQLEPRNKLHAVNTTRSYIHAIHAKVECANEYFPPSLPQKGYPRRRCVVGK